MKFRQLACLVFPMAAIVFGGTARGAIISQYSFTDVVAGQLNRSATTVDPNATAGNITDAPTVNNNPTVVLARGFGNGYTAEPNLQAERANFNESSVADNVYFSFMASPNAGYKLNLSSLTFNAARGGGATPRTYDIRTSLDSFATSVTGGPVAINTQRPTYTAVSLDLSAAQYQNLVSPLTFQFRFMTPTVLQFIEFDDITLNGLVVPVPEPSSTLPVLAMFGAWMIRRRQRKV